MKYRIAISGSYGGMNLGDEAILQGILKELRASIDAEIVIFSYNPKDTEMRHKVRAVPIREMHKDQVIEELKTLDLFILGGGGILFDDLVEKFLRDVTWAQELGIPVMIYAVSVGPLKNPDSKQLVTEVLNKVNIITVRENESKKILNDLGVTKEIEVTADPAFLIEPQTFTKEMLKQEGINPDISLVGFSVREPGPAAPDLNVEHYHEILASAADFMVERFDAQILFIPLEPNFDSQHSHAVISKMTNPQHSTVLKGDYTSYEILGLFEHMAFAVGMRLHFLIFSAIQCIPFVPLQYASKVKGLLEDLEISVVPINDWNTGKLCAVLDRTWDNRTNLQETLRQKVPLLKEKAEKTNQILCEFLQTIKPKNN